MCGVVHTTETICSLIIGTMRERPILEVVTCAKLFAITLCVLHCYLLDLMIVLRAKRIQKTAATVAMVAVLIVELERCVPVIQSSRA